MLRLLRFETVEPTLLEFCFRYCSAFRSIVALSCNISWEPVSVSGHSTSRKCEPTRRRHYRMEKVDVNQALSLGYRTHLAGDCVLEPQRLCLWTISKSMFHLDQLKSRRSPVLVVRTTRNCCTGQGPLARCAGSNVRGINKTPCLRSRCLYAFPHWHPYNCSSRHASDRP